jgi:hypothetical protein
MDVGGISNLIFDYDGPNGNLQDCGTVNNLDWSQKYCPEKYCNLIQTMVDLDVAFVQRAYLPGTYKENAFFEGDPWYKVGLQIIRDINYAFDCAGKRRPIVQAFVGEILDADLMDSAPLYDTPGPNPGGIDLNIPCWIIKKYFEIFPDDMTQENIDYYFESGGNPRNDLYFRSDRVSTSLPNQSRPSYDINLVEMRMYFLYQCITVINMGYKSIHMGVYYSYGKSTLDNDGQDYNILYNLTKAIREYAASVGSFVILSGEPPMGQSAIYTTNDTTFYIFDFDSRAMRPREFDTSGIENYGGDGGSCTEEISQEFINTWDASPCSSEEYPAVVDPCTIQNFGGNITATHPLGCSLNQLPYTVHFDGFSNPINPGVPSSANQWNPSTLTYGFHDHQWFSMLEPSCQAWWYSYFYCERRNYGNGNGFIVLPGIIQYKIHPEINDEPPAYMIISENQILQNSISSLLDVKTPTINLRRNIKDSYFSKKCGGRVAPAGSCFKVIEAELCVSVGNEDCSSKYSIHIKKPNGSFLPQLLGNGPYCFLADLQGSYQIGVRQDNLGLPASSNGTQIIETSFTTCLGPDVSPECVFNIIDVENTCNWSSGTSKKYSVSIVSSDSLIQILAVEALNDELSDSLIFQSSNIVNLDIILPDADDELNLRLKLKSLETLEVYDYITTDTLNDCDISDRQFSNNSSAQYDGKSFELYPNPSNGLATLFVRGENNFIERFSLSNSLSQVLFQKDNSDLFIKPKEEKIVTKDLTPGQYFVNVVTSKFTLTKVIIVQ